MSTTREPPLLHVARSAAEQEVCEWMRAAALRDKNRHPLLVVTGPTAAGKTRLVVEAARRQGLETIHLGSSSTRGSAAVLASKVAVGEWMAVVQARHMQPTIVFIDDADAVTIGGDGVRQTLFVDMAHCATAVVIACESLYATPYLRKLVKSTPQVQRVALDLPSTDEVARFMLARAPPGVESSVVEQIAEAVQGDLRRAAALLDMEVCYRRAGGAEQWCAPAEGRRETAAARLNHFDRANHMLGLASHFPSTATVDALGDVDTQETANQMFHTHYLNALPQRIDSTLDGGMEAVAETARNLSIMDRLRFVAPAVSRCCGWLSASRYRQRTADIRSRRRRPKYAGPLVGRVTKRYLDARRQWPRAAAVARRYEVESRASTDFGVEDVTSNDAQAASQLTSSDAAARILHRLRFDAHRLGAKPDESALVSPDVISKTLAKHTRATWTAPARSKTVQLSNSART